MNLPKYVIPLLIAACIIVFAIAAGIRAQRKARELAQAIQRAALELGLSYQLKGDKAFVKAWSVLKHTPKNGKADNIVYGILPNGHSLTAFQHKYVVSTGKSAHVVVHSVYAIDTPVWPDVGIERINAVTRWIKGLFKGSKSAPSPQEPVPFDTMWKVITKDQPFAATLLTPQVRAVIQSSDLPTAWRFTGGKLSLVTKKAMTPDDLTSAIALLSQMWESLPADLPTHADEAPVGEVA